jgi:uncharacterized protein
VPSPVRLLQLVAGCAMLGTGVTLLLLPGLGADGYSNFVYGLTLTTGLPFLAINVLVAIAFIAMAWVRGVRPGIGTVAQILVVGLVITTGLAVIPAPDALWSRLLVGLVGLPVLATGIATYLGTHLGAGPTEGAALAWDPPLPFAISYNSIQAITALAGWWLGVAPGLGTLAYVVLMGPLVTLVGRLLRLDLHQPGPRAERV